MSLLGDKIKEIRINNKLTQQELADKLYVSDKTISSWECNRTVPEIDMLLKISNIFDINFYFLIDDDYCNKIPIEIEVKLKVDLNEYNRLFKLIANNREQIEVYQKDIYYVPTFKNFDNEWLRIRKENNKYILTYKKKINDKCCNEYESLFDNFNNLESIINNLGFVRKGIVEKKRIKIMYQDKYEFSFDYIDNVGYFVEIEVKKFTASQQEEIVNLKELLNDLNVDLNLINSKRYFDYL